MTEQRPCSRRLFLLGTATTFAGAILAACGSDDPVETAISDVPVGSAVIIGEYIIAQPTAGEYKAFSAICPHQSWLISEVEGSVVRCTNHNSRFSIATGEVLEGPSRKPLTATPITINGDRISTVKS
ncbi:Rieske (2Fe-2S) protein [Corynebacterium caspium]|uniref:Rieske (2Fe-2S) protein n=1 Tax=Corynebacterium caspium TaxID=234828 RepID=UPI00037C7E2C|nr:Rieske 2Fe-2S domain-containing protein [Corynebacterium caspium]WKD60048.1 Toluene 1,2-dioxygenase system ferredoxin subunit [Corynebacterium caspium DSM 44850]